MEASRRPKDSGSGFSEKVGCVADPTRQRYARTPSNLLQVVAALETRESNQKAPQAFDHFNLDPNNVETLNIGLCLGPRVSSTNGTGLAPLGHLKRPNVVAVCASSGCVSCRCSNSYSPTPNPTTAAATTTPPMPYSLSHATGGLQLAPWASSPTAKDSLKIPLLWTHPHPHP